MLFSVAVPANDKRSSIIPISSPLKTRSSAEVAAGICKLGEKGEKSWAIYFTTRTRCSHIFSHLLSSKPKARQKKKKNKLSTKSLKIILQLTIFYICIFSISRVKVSLVRNVWILHISYTKGLQFSVTKLMS